MYTLPSYCLSWIKPLVRSFRSQERSETTKILSPSVCSACPVSRSRTEGIRVVRNVLNKNAVPAGTALIYYVHRGKRDLPYALEITAQAIREEISEALISKPLTNNPPGPESHFFLPPEYLFGLCFPAIEPGHKFSRIN